MQLQSIAMFPVIMVTLVVPHTYSVQDVFFSSNFTTTEITAFLEESEEIEIVENVNPNMEVQVGEKETLELYPDLIPVCSCESTGSPFNEPKQFKPNGEVIRGHIHPPDTGMCQINAKVWLETAEGLGFNIETEEGNISMANYIYEKYGLQPWYSSKHCWSKVIKE